MAIYPKQLFIIRCPIYFSLQQTSAKPFGALDILIAVNASQLKKHLGIVCFFIILSSLLNEY